MLRSVEQQAVLAANIRKATQGLPPKAIAEALDVTEQAVSGWKRTGKIATQYLLPLSRLTSWSIEALLRPADADSPEFQAVRQVDVTFANGTRKVVYQEVAAAPAPDAQAAATLTPAALQVAIQIDSSPARSALLKAWENVYELSQKQPEPTAAPIEQVVTPIGTKKRRS